MKTNHNELEEVFKDLLEGLIKNHPRTPIEELEEDFQKIKKMTLKENDDYLERLQINKKIN